jgi:hypothetical protein
VNLKYLFDCTIDIVITRRFAVEHFDREGTAGNCKARGLAVEVGKLKRRNVSDEPVS